MSEKAEIENRVLEKLKGEFSIIREGLWPTMTHTGRMCKRLNLIIYVTPDEVPAWDRIIEILEREAEIQKASCPE